MNGPYIHKWSRRETLQWLAASTLTLSLPRAESAAGGNDAVVSFTAHPGGYGTDPALTGSVAPWRRIFNQHQMQQAAVISDLILPPTNSALAPSVLGVPEFIDEWVSAPYPDQQRDRGTIIEGLSSLDSHCTDRWNKTFLLLDSTLQCTLVDELARSSSTRASDARADFFRTMRFLVVSAYYTTPEGFADIGYTGNTPLLNYPNLTVDEASILQKAFADLGLTEPARGHS
jgi:hypothetical protein